MLADDEMRSIDRGLIPIKIIWILLLIACGVYLIIANVIGTEGTVTGGDEPDEVFDLVGYILYVFGAINIIMAYYFRKAIINPKGIISRFFSPRSTPGLPTTASGGNTQSAIARYSAGVIMCIALIEAIAIYGLIIFMIKADYFSLYLLIGIAIAALVYFRPKKQEVIDLTIQLNQDNPK